MMVMISAISSPVNQPFVGFLLGDAAKLYTVEDEALLTSVYWM